MNIKICICHALYQAFVIDNVRANITHNITQQDSIYMPE